MLKWPRTTARYIVGCIPCEWLCVASLDTALGTSMQEYETPLLRRLDPYPILKDDPIRRQAARLDRSPLTQLRKASRTTARCIVGSIRCEWLRVASFGHSLTLIRREK